MDKLFVLLFVMLGGGLGAGLRWSLIEIAGFISSSMWVATLFANFLGTLLYFFTLKFALNELSFDQYFLRIGFCGSLTTFSTLTYEVALSFKNGQYLQASAILGLNILTGVLIAVGMLR